MLKKIPKSNWIMHRSIKSGQDSLYFVFCHWSFYSYLQNKQI